VVSRLARTFERLGLTRRYRRVRYDLLVLDARGLSVLLEPGRLRPERVLRREFNAESTCTAPGLRRWGNESTGSEPSGLEPCTVASSLTPQSTDGFAYSFSTYLISLGGLHVGSHFASIIAPLLAPCISRLRARRTRSRGHDDGKTPPTRHSAPVLDALTILSAALAYAIALLLYFLAPHPWRHRATFPILLAPPGTILRFALSKLNPRRSFVDRFPIGTFLANMVATLVIAGTYAAQRTGSSLGNTLRCDALYAVQQGFCGCLSTVSTFVVETRSIPRKRWKWFYVGVSVVLGQVFVLAIVGGVGWTEGYGPVCTGSD